MASRTQTEKRYAPVSAPVVTNRYVGLVEYGWTRLHTPAGDFIQNSYRGLGQPVAAAEIVATVPRLAVVAGAAVAVTVGHVGVNV